MLGVIDMGKHCLTILVLSVFFIGGFLCAQEKTEEQTEFEWTEELDWDPPAALLRGIEQIGDLTTGSDAIRLSSPTAITSSNNGVYVYDSELGNLLLFDAEGHFEESLIREGQKVEGNVRRLFVREDGSLMLDAFSNLYFLKDGEVTRRANYHLIYSPVWIGNKVIGVNSQMHELFDGIIQEGQKGGIFQAADTAMVASMIVCMGDMWALKRWYFKRTYSLDKYVNDFTEMIFKVLGAS